MDLIQSSSLLSRGGLYFYFKVHWGTINRVKPSASLWGHKNILRHMTILSILKEALTGKYVEVFKNEKSWLSLAPFYPSQPANHEAIVVDVILDNEGDYSSFCVITQNGDEIMIKSY